jgi:UDP-glucose:(heptosyl)LPS alpha-1,3-glucosyltransferase
MKPPPRLRIAVLSRNFVSTGGGAERYSIALAEQLAADHEVHVFAQNIEHQHPRMHYHRVGMPLQRPRWINQLYYATATWWATRKGFNIVHSHENTWHGNVQTVHVLPVKHNLLHGRSGLRRAMRWLKIITSPRLLAYLGLEWARYRITKPRAIVSVSQTLHQIMLQTYPGAKDALRVIPPGIDSVPGLATPERKAASRMQLALPLDGRCVLFVGNDFRKKGLPTLIAVLQHLPADVYLAVAGNSAQMAEMRKIVSECGVEKRVHFLGALKKIDVAYVAADMLVHPTLEDTYAMVVLEAMAHGLPVVVSAARYCGIAAELQHGQNALIVQNPKSVEDVSSFCEIVLFDNETKGLMSKNAIEFAKDNCWDNVVNTHAKIYYALKK